MDSIIARQKIGKRRPAPRPALQGPRSSPYVPILQGKPARRNRRGAKFPGLGSRLALLGLRAREGLALGLRQGIRSLAREAGRIPKARLVLVAGAAIAGSFALAAVMAAVARGPAFPMPASGLLPAEDSVQNLLLDYASPEPIGAGIDGAQDSGPLPPPPATLELSTYTVRSGDSIGSIAKRFGLYADTIVSANRISSASSVRTGMQLRIPNINGLIHKVRAGENLASIAKRYGVDTTRIVDANDLGSSRLLSGQALFIPGARLPESALRQALGQKVAWPLRGPLSSYFGYRADPFTGIRRFHAGIDIVADSGSAVRAAMDGRVADVGYNANYGNYIILSHADGYQTLYGHLSASLAPVGAAVTQGSVIGKSGNTGYSTGPHLHFGLFRRSLALNPLKYLK